MSTKRILFVREDYDISGIANCFLKEEKISLNGFALYFEFFVVSWGKDERSWVQSLRHPPILSQ